MTELMTLRGSRARPTRKYVSVTSVELDRLNRTPMVSSTPIPVPIQAPVGPHTGSGMMAPPATAGDHDNQLVKAGHQRS